MVTASGRRMDVAAKDFGFYATPSVNGRLKGKGSRLPLSAMVRPDLHDGGRAGPVDAFDAYCTAESRPYWSGWMNAPWTEDTIQSVLVANRFRAPDTPFLTLIGAEGEETHLTYDALVRKAERWAATYASAGISPGERIVVIFEHGEELYTAYIGALLMGAVPAMFAHPSPKLSEEVYFETIGALLESSQAAALATWPDLADRLQPVTDRVSGMRKVLTEAGLTTATASPIYPSSDPDAPAFLQYSSGTTGLKKGVMISHRALLWQVRNYAKAIQATEKDTIVSWLPLYHDMGLIACFFLPLITRCRLVAIVALRLGKAAGNVAGCCHASSRHTQLAAELRLCLHGEECAKGRP